MPGFVPQVTCGSSSATSISTSRSKSASSSVRSSRQRVERALPVRALRRAGPALEVGERRVVGRDHAGARAGLDRHVADRHAPLHRERRGSASPAYSRTWPTAPPTPMRPIVPEDHVLRRDAERKLALVQDAHRLRPRPRQTTASPGRARPPTCRCRRRARRTRRASRCGCRRRRSSSPGWVSPSSGPIDVDDPLAPAAGRVERDAELGAVRAQRLELRAWRAGRVTGPCVGRERCGPSSRARGRAGGPLRPASRKPVEGLRRRDLVDQVEVDVEERRLARLLAHDVALPDPVEERLRHGRTVPACVRPPPALMSRLLRRRGRRRGEASRPQGQRPWGLFRWSGKEARR